MGYGPAMLSLDALATAQPQAISLLQAAITHDRLHHAYILSGQHLSEANDIAHAAAQTLLCQQRTAIGPVVACGECPACRTVDNGNHPDFVRLSPNDKDIIPIQPVRDLASRLALRSSEGGMKVALISSADQMNPAAQNALLKTLEEPPGPTCFFLTVRRYNALLPTVRSRSQRIRLGHPSAAASVRALTEADISQPLAELLAPVTNGDHQHAQAWVDAGAEEIHQTLQRALSNEATDSDILEVAGDLGSDRQRCQISTLR